MESKKNSISLFVTLIILSFFLFLFDRWGIFGSIRSFLAGIVAPAQKVTYGATLSLPFVTSVKIKQIEQERNDVLEKLTQFKTLQEENESLRLQLTINHEQPNLFFGKKLLLAHVLGRTNGFMLDRGSNDGVQIGDTVLFKNNLIGKIVLAGPRLSKVLLISDKDSVIEVKTVQSGAKGLARGLASEMILSDVLLSEKLEEGDVVVSRGNVDEKGLGILPNLVIGKINGVTKSRNQLFQEAKIVPFIDNKSIEDVFIAL